jgi:hypothetical protein
MIQYGHGVAEVKEGGGVGRWAIILLMFICRICNRERPMKNFKEYLH